jgi:hypothetical protein
VRAIASRGLGAVQRAVVVVGRAFEKLDAIFDRVGGDAGRGGDQDRLVAVDIFVKSLKMD